MKVSIKRSLVPILNSKNGIHLTAYLPRARNLIELKSQLREVYYIADEYLKPVLAPAARKAFLAPLNGAIKDTSGLKKIQENLGIFLTKDYIRFLSIPVEVEQTCILANSFHIKPLLKWLQNDEEFLLVGLGKTFVSIYQGTQTALHHLDRMILPENIKSREAWNETMKTVAHWIYDVCSKNRPLIFFAGDEEMMRTIQKYLKYENIFEERIGNNYLEKHAFDFAQKCRSIIKIMARQKLNQFLKDFDGSELIKTNIYEIAEAAIHGKIKKLVISDETKIFGKINHDTGSVTIHGDDLDHEDDDLLDDIAQTVLNFGGEVIVAQKNQLPHKKPILALLDSDFDDENSYLRFGANL